MTEIASVPAVGGKAKPAWLSGTFGSLTPSVPLTLLRGPVRPMPVACISLTPWTSAWLRASSCELICGRSVLRLQQPGRLTAGHVE